MSKTTHIKKDKFLTAYAKNPNIKDCCELIKIARKTFYRWCEDDEEFKAKFEDIEEEGIDELERIAYERAKSYSDTLLIFLLKNKRKHIYGDKLAVDQTTKHKLPELTDDEIKRIDKAIFKHRTVDKKKKQ